MARARKIDLGFDYESHGMSRSPEYRVWKSMMERCRNDNHRQFDAYGGRGIEVCERWQRSFMSFYQDMGPRPDGTSIDRIDNDGGYHPGNCRWATPKVQSNNRRRPKRTDNKLGCIGVYRNKKKYSAQITRHGKTYNLGTYEDIFDAICARKSAENNYL